MKDEPVRRLIKEEIVELVNFKRWKRSGVTLILSSSDASSFCSAAVFSATRYQHNIAAWLQALLVGQRHHGSDIRNLSKFTHHHHIIVFEYRGTIS